METLDDAGVYKLTDDLAIIQTVDFFTPVVDDPYMFGQIAAANALSDVYTMGGKPITAMNIVSFPVGSMDISVLKDILRGGLDKMAEAGVVLLGGHSIDDPELKYGLSVTGTVHPDKMITNSGARVGDNLILTKPLGTGIVNTAVKAGVADKETIAAAVSSMAALNDKASELMLEMGINTCTDITGFGLIGHTIQIAKNSQAGIRIDTGALPILPRAGEFADQGLCPGGLQRNRDFYSPSVVINGDIPQSILDILYDPQTSGGLLIGVDPDKARRLLDSIKEAGMGEAAIIGEVISRLEGTVLISG